MGYTRFDTPFNARSVAPNSFPDPPVLADYHVVVVDADMKPNNKGTGGYLELTLNILDPGPYKDRKIAHRIHIFHSDPQTAAIAQAQLSAVSHVVGVFDVQDAQQFFNIPFIAQIGPQANNPQYSNVFKVKDLNGNIPGQTPAAAAAPSAGWGPPPATAPPAVAPAGQPWGPPAAAAPAPAPAPAWGPPAGQPPQVAPPAQPAWGAPPPAQPAQPAWGAPPPPAQPAAPSWTPPGAAAPAAPGTPPWGPPR